MPDPVAPPSSPFAILSDPDKVKAMTFRLLPYIPDRLFTDDEILAAGLEYGEGKVDASVIATTPSTLNAVETRLVGTITPRSGAAYPATFLGVCVVSEGKVAVVARLKAPRVVLSPGLPCRLSLYVRVGSRYKVGP